MDVVLFLIHSLINSTDFITKALTRDHYKNKIIFHDMAVKIFSTLYENNMCEPILRKIAVKYDQLLLVCLVSLYMMHIFCLV